MKKENFKLGDMSKIKRHYEDIVEEERVQDVSWNLEKDLEKAVSNFEELCNELLEEEEDLGF